MFIVLCVATYTGLSQFTLIVYYYIFGQNSFRLWPHWSLLSNFCKLIWQAPWILFVFISVGMIYLVRLIISVDITISLGIVIFGYGLTAICFTAGSCNWISLNSSNWIQTSLWFNCLTCRLWQLLYPLPPVFTAYSIFF